MSTGDFSVTEASAWEPDPKVSMRLLGRSPLFSRLWTLADVHGWVHDPIQVSVGVSHGSCKCENRVMR